MTRTTITTKKGDVLLDAYHNHDRDVAAAVIVGNGEVPSIEFPEAAPCDIEINGWESHNFDQRIGRFEIFLNGEQVTEGNLQNRTSSAVTVGNGGATIEIPPHQNVKIFVWGEEVDE